MIAVRPRPSSEVGSALPSESGSALQIRRAPGPAAWEACRAVQPGATVFHRWDWLTTMAQALDKLFLPLGFYRGDTLVGLAPLLVKQRGPFKNANWAPFPYLGPLVPVALWPRALRALDDYQRRNGIGLIGFGLAPDAAVDRDALRAAGYAIHTDTTLLLPLAGRSEEDLWAGMTSHGRKNVKRAERDGVEVRASTEDEIKRELPAITEEVFSSQDGPPPYPPAAARLFWDRYHDDPEVRMATAWRQGQPAAISITVGDGDGRQAFFWQGAGRRQFRNANPNAAVYWDGIRWARARGYAQLDMVGAPDPGIAYYKSTFGAIDTPYVVATRENSRLTAWVRQAHHRARELTHGRQQ